MDSAIKYLDDNFWTYDKLQKTIWANPELGFIEYNSSKLLQDHLRENVWSDSCVCAMTDHDLSEKEE